MHGQSKGTTCHRQKPPIYSFEVDARYGNGIRKAKVLPVAPESPHFISIEVDACYDKGICKVKVPLIAPESFCYVSVEVGVCYDRGILQSAWIVWSLHLLILQNYAYPPKLP